MTSKCLSRLRKMFQGAPWACKRPIYWAHNRSLELIYDALTLRNGKSCIIQNQPADSGLPTDDAEMSNLNATFCSGINHLNVSR